MRHSPFKWLRLADAMQLHPKGLVRVLGGVSCKTMDFYVRGCRAQAIQRMKEPSSHVAVKGAIPCLRSPLHR
jgi:hypothetical protein